MTLSAMLPFSWVFSHAAAAGSNRDSPRGDTAEATRLRRGLEPEPRDLACDGGLPDAEQRRDVPVASGPPRRAEASAFIRARRLAHGGVERRDRRSPQNREDPDRGRGVSK